MGAQQIGKLMKAGQADKAEVKKREVEGINEVADSAEGAFIKVGPRTVWRTDRM